MYSCLQISSRFPLLLVSDASLSLSLSLYLSLDSFLLISSLFPLFFFSDASCACPPVSSKLGTKLVVN